VNEAHIVERAVETLIKAFDPEPKRSAFVDTPSRVRKALSHLTEGHQLEVELKDSFTTFENDGEADQMILLKDIEYYSLCEHHLLPFFGRAAVAYIPSNKYAYNDGRKWTTANAGGTEMLTVHKGERDKEEDISLRDKEKIAEYGYDAVFPRIVGISKLARIVEAFARRFQTQERMTNQIASFLNQALTPPDVPEMGPLGVAVKVEGVHFCMRARGVRQQSSSMETTKLLGVFLTDADARAEFTAALR